MQNQMGSEDEELETLRGKRKGGEHRDADGSRDDRRKNRRVEADTLPSPSSSSPDVAQHLPAGSQFSGGRNFHISGGQFYHVNGNVNQSHLHPCPEADLALPPLDPPPPPTMIFGRQRDFEAVLGIICNNKHPVIHGLGGIGKSSLARNILAEPSLQTRFKRREFIACHTCHSAEALTQELLRLVRHRDSDENNIAAIQKALRSEPILLVLDNFETPFDRDGAGVTRLLEYFVDCPSTILITTRTSSVPTELDPARMKYESYELCSLDGIASQELFLQRAPEHAGDKDLPRRTSPLLSPCGRKRPPRTRTVLGPTTRSEVFASH